MNIKRSLPYDGDLFLLYIFCFLAALAALTASKCCSSYLCFVASPPLICRCCLFSSKISFTLAYKAGDIPGSRSERSLCTVDLLTPKAFAVARTVVRRETIYSPKITGRSLSDSTIIHTPIHFYVVKYMHGEL